LIDLTERISVVRVMTISVLSLISLGTSSHRNDKRAKTGCYQYAVEADFIDMLASIGNVVCGRLSKT